MNCAVFVMLYPDYTVSHSDGAGSIVESPMLHAAPAKLLLIAELPADVPVVFVHASAKERTLFDMSALESGFTAPSTTVKPGNVSAESPE